MSEQMEAFVKITRGGSITIPAYLRRAFCIEPGDSYKLTAGDSDLMFSRVAAKCSFCGASALEVDLTDLCGKKICSKCRETVRKEVSKNGKRNK